MYCCIYVNTILLFSDCIDGAHSADVRLSLHTNRICNDCIHTQDLLLTLHGSAD